MTLSATKEEQKAIDALKKLEKIWPKSLWIFATGNGLHVMRCGKNGEHMTDSYGSMDEKRELAYITGIDNDGGDF